MKMKISDILPYVRQLLNDKDSQSYRYSDSDLLAFSNDAIRRISLIRPDIFTQYESIYTTEGTVLQKIPDTIDRVVDINYVVGGNAVKKEEKGHMDIESPGWPNDKEGQTKFWMRDPKSRNYFYIYPKAPRSQILVATTLKVPQLISINEEFELPNLYKSILIDGIVFLCQSIDDEHISSGRAKLFQDLLTTSLGQDMQSTEMIMDADEGRKNKE